MGKPLRAGLKPARREGRVLDLELRSECLDLLPSRTRVSEWRALASPSFLKGVMTAGGFRIGEQGTGRRI